MSGTGGSTNPPGESVNYTIPVDGTYYVRVRAFSAGTGNYHLAAGTLLVNPKPHALEVDPNGNGVWEPGETVRLQIELGNEWRPVQGVSVRLVSDGPQATVLSGHLPAGSWPSRRAGTMTVELRVADEVAWGASGPLRLEIRGGGAQQDLPLPLALRGPVVKAGWPAAGAAAASLNGRSQSAAPSGPGLGATGGGG